MKKTYIVKIDENDLEYLKETLSKFRIRDFEKNEKFHRIVKNVCESFIERQKSEKVLEATQRATLTRKNAVRAKIQNAINILRIEGKEITPYRVAKTAEISFNTAKKYLNEINLHERSE